MKEPFIRLAKKAVILAWIGCTMPLMMSCSEQQGTQAQLSQITAETSAAGSESAATEPAAPEAPFDAEGMHFSAKSGFYDAGFSLTITGPEGAAIYYTLDGSTPDADSLRYEAPIPVADRSSEENKLSTYKTIAQPIAYADKFVPKSKVDKATVIKAVAIDENGRKSGVVTNTYFVGFDRKASYYQNTKVVSLVLDEASLFDDEQGIYVRGKVYEDWENSDDYDPETPDYFMPGNYTQRGREWERVATFQLFEGGQLVLSQDVGIRIHGGATRSYPQKSLNVYARKEYGAGKLTYDLFSGSVTSETDGAAITEYDSFVLRNGGNDAQYTRFSDKLVQSLVSDRQFLTQGMEPCIVMINGEYWGHYELTERLDDDFISAHCGVPAKEICLIKKEALEEGSEETYAEWQQLWQWIKDTDFSEQTAYEELCSKVDMQGFMDYVSTEIYINNADWGKANTAMWKAETCEEGDPYADGRWRFVLFDTEYSAGLYGKAEPDEDSFETLIQTDCFLADLFAGAMENSGFREQFRSTFLEIAGQNFSRERVNAAIDQYEAAYHDMTIDTYDRFWGRLIGGSRAEGNYESAVDSLRSFYDERYDYITAYLEQCLQS